MAVLRPRIGVSSCLLGEPVRYDGGTKRQAFLADTLTPFVEWVPMCPEVEIGLGVPREPIRLERWAGETRLVGTLGMRDFTDPMRTWSTQRLKQLAAQGLCGFVLKANSPSCGPFGVPIHGSDGNPLADGSGIFAGRLIEALPNLAIVQETELQEPAAAEAFVARVFGTARWNDHLRRDGDLEGLARFHERNRLLVLSRSPETAIKLGDLFGATAGPVQLANEYGPTYLRALRRIPGHVGHARALRVALAALDTTAPGGDLRALRDAIAEYEAHRAPLSVPLDLASRLAREHVSGPLAEDAYWEPHPRALGLLDRV